MKKLQMFTGALLLKVVLIGACTKIDNYALPGETLIGKVIDKNTGEPLQTATYDVMIRLDELSWSDNPEPYRFSIKPDGSFSNTKVFAGSYRVTPVDGPFHPIDGKELEINGIAEVSFEVEPFLNIDVIDMQQSGGKVTARFRISSSSDAYKVTDAQLFVANTSFVSDGSNIPALKRSLDLSGRPNAEIYADELEIVTEGLASGRTYYVRAGARVDDPISRKYNYSEVFELRIP